MHRFGPLGDFHIHDWRPIRNNPGRHRCFTCKALGYERVMRDGRPTSILCFRCTFVLRKDKRWNRCKNDAIHKDNQRCAEHGASPPRACHEELLPEDETVEDPNPAEL